MNIRDTHYAGPGSGELQELLLSTESLKDFLDEISTRLVNGDGSLSAGVTVRSSQRLPYTLSSSDATAERLDSSQYAVGDGPCLYALRETVPVKLTSMDQAEQWPHFQQQAEAEGVVSSFSVPIDGTSSYRHEPLGALNLYTRGRSFEDGDYTWGHELAERISASVALAVQLDEQRRLTHDLQSALVSRTTIDQALGILMAQRGCGADEAFATLRRTSQDHNVKLREIAAAIVENTSGQPPQQAPPVT